MAQTTTNSPLSAIGMDLGDHKSVVAFLHEDDTIRTVSVKTTLADIIKRNTGITDVQDAVFFAEMSDYS